MKKYLLSIFKGHILLRMMISLLYTILWFSMFLLFSTFFEENIELACLFFLMVYLLLAQPLKDSSITYFFRKQEDTFKARQFRFLSHLDQADDITEALSIIRKILRKLKITHVDVYFSISDPHGIRLSSERGSKKTQMEYLKNEELEAYIQNDPWGKSTQDYPGNLQSYLDEKKIHCIVPIVFRGILLGFFSFSHILKKHQIRIFEYIAQRLALLKHNQLLDQEINLSKEIERDFLLARKVEFFLESEDHIHVFDYTLEKIKQGWQDKYFPVYYEVKTKQISGRMRKQQNNKEINYIILCRPNKNLRRGSIMKLCLIQGYFISLCESSNNLLKLTNRMSRVIRNHIDEEFGLEGFIIMISSQQILVQHFGKQLEILNDMDPLKLNDNPPLGSRRWKRFDLIRIKFKKEVQFLIRNYPLLSIKKQSANLHIDKLPKNILHPRELSVS